MTEHRRMLLSGPESGRWAPIDAETAERMLKTPYGIGGIGDQLADVGQYWEERKNGGAWTTLSYWPGAIDFWRRARLMLVERREGDERLLREKAQRLRDGAGAAIEGIKNQIAAAEAALKQALEDEKRDKADAKGLDKQADVVRADIDALRREIERAPEPVTA